ncbi:MAG TPA: amidohydrolase family protein, partial [Xanthomonadales bacterium]|nr:amidohydrolase family protein [Xanthomonadales bacterium]
LDPLSNLPSDFDSIGARLDNAALLHQAGVSISFSMSGDSTHNARKLRYAAGVAVANGLPFAAGLEALTINPASIFNLPEGYGSIAANAPANLVMWTGDPLEVTTMADAVILNGKSIPMVSRQTLLRDRYLPQNPELPRAYITR